MGAQIAAHLANAGLPVLLFDVTSDAARKGLARASQLLPDPFFVPDAASLITIGGLDDLSALSSADWIIEAIVERLDVKRALAARVDAVRAAGAIVSSNTSGISLAAIALGRSDGFRRHWIGTHFFNPPRYLRLVEIVPTADTDPGVTARIADFIDRRLGKGVVLAKDTPAFIANHLGVHGVVRTLEEVASGRLTIEEVDAITGPVIGRPKSATFRTADLAGLDILAHVAADLAARLPGEAARRAFVLPEFVHRMIERGLLGDKTGQGFYKKVKDGSGSKILTLDLTTFEYREREPPNLPSLEAANSTGDLAARLRALFLGRDRAGEFLRETLGSTLVYAARTWPDMAYSIDDVDRAMRWGFGWDLGPFETWDAIGVRAVQDACGVTEPLALVAADRDRIRATGLPPAQPDFLIVQTARARGGVVKASAGASLIDLGDDVLGLEFHSKMNTIGADAIEMLHAGVAEASARFAALVVGNDAPNFSAGADLLLLARAAEDGRWADVDQMVREFQRATMALKTCPVPVVIAPGGLALGGGCEICLHGDRVQAAAETYIGLVEVGVGLIPAGGGTKEMLIRAAASATGADHRRAVQRVFETLGFGKTSTSAPGARRLGYLRDVDGISMNRERLIADAKRLALTRVGDGYQAPAPRTAVRVGGADAYATLSLGVHLAWRAGRISDHDALVGRKLAGILTGGPTAHATTVSEDYLLDLEREAFLSLCGERKTLDRIRYTLRTGKTLRN
jgi:3-hydroxyacyl-CoA dehydrogenase